jgi:hypothetical protein
VFEIEHAIEFTGMRNGVKNIFMAWRSSRCRAGLRQNDAIQGNGTVRQWCRRGLCLLADSLSWVVAPQPVEAEGSENVTFIFSTHDKLVMDFSRRLIKLHDGRIVEDVRRG